MKRSWKILKSLRNVYYYRDVFIFNKIDGCKNYDFGSIFVKFINTSVLWIVVNICQDL